MKSVLESLGATIIELTRMKKEKKLKENTLYKEKSVFARFVNV